MFRLVLNDIRANVRALIFLFILLNGVMVLAQLGAFRPQTNATLVGLSFAMIVPLPLLLRGAQFHILALQRSLPIPPTTVVWAKYLSVLTIAVGTILYSLLCTYILGQNGFAFQRHIAPDFPYVLETGYAFPHTFISRGIFYVTVLCVCLPLVFAAGTVLRIVWGTIFILFLRTFAIGRLLDFSLHSSFAIGINAWVFFVFVTSALFILLSQEISVWILRQRDL